MGRGLRVISFAEKMTLTPFSEKMTLTLSHGRLPQARAPAQ